MNTMMIFFFTSLILEDYFYRDGMLWSFLIKSVIFCWIFSTLVKKGKSHTVEKKILMASYTQSYDPTIYVKMKFDIKNAKEFLEKIEKTSNKKISMTLYMAKCLAELFKKYPDFNKAIKFGNLHDKKTIDISILVDVGGKVKIIIKLGPCICNSQRYC
jgi:hypothetical protein